MLDEQQGPAEQQPKPQRDAANAQHPDDHLGASSHSPKAQAKPTTRNTLDTRVGHEVDAEQLALSSAGALLIGVLYFLLPDGISLGPSWALLVVVLVLLAPVLVSAFVLRRRFPLPMARPLALILLAVVTIALIGSVVLWIGELTRLANAFLLLRTAAILWGINILLFGSWYWEVDGGGPIARRQSGHQAADFLFPQQLDGNTRSWVPKYIDYVYVAFGFATAFSPTDTPPLGRRVKLLTMLEAVISLAVVGILLARTVNIIK